MLNFILVIFCVVFMLLIAVRYLFVRKIHKAIVTTSRGKRKFEGHISHLKTEISKIPIEWVREIEVFRGSWSATGRVCRFNYGEFVRLPEGFDSDFHGMGDNEEGGILKKEVSARTCRRTKRIRQIINITKYVLSK